MLIAQISDFHLVPRDEMAYGQVNTGKMLRHAVEMINRLRPQPALVIGSGDLVQSGRACEYSELVEILSDLRATFAPVVGNHDERGNLAAAFGEELHYGSDCFIQYARTIGQYQIIILDSVTPGSSEPSFCQTRASWLNDLLSSSSQQSILVTHHPLFATGIGWMEPSDPDWPRLLGRVIADHRPQIIGLLSGHIHRAIHSRAFDVPASSCPSTAHQVALDLEAHDARFSHETPGFQLHRAERGKITTYTVSLRGLFDIFTP